MEMTLDDYLVEVDRWKQPVSDLMLEVPVTERANLNREASAWLEQKLGRTLRQPPPKDKTGRTAPN
jgi:hypothetical protein